MLWILSGMIDCEPQKKKDLVSFSVSVFLFFCARTKDGKARIVRVIPYTGLYRNMFDCVVTLECYGMNGNVKTVEMSYNSKDYRDS